LRCVTAPRLTVRGPTRARALGGAGAASDRLLSPGAREVRAHARGPALARFRGPAPERSGGAARLGREGRGPGGPRLRARRRGSSVRGAASAASERVAGSGAAEVPLAGRALPPA